MLTSSSESQAALKSLLSSVVLALAGLLGSARGESVSDYAVRVSATVQTNPALIALSWPADPAATGYTLYRKSRDATTWGAGITLANDATSYVDSVVTVGTGYEYRISKTTTNYNGEGYLYTGIALPLVDARGKVVLIVDATHATSLAMELARLQRDLVGDGWAVLRHDVGRTSAVGAVRNLIKADYNADPGRVKAVFLFGHVPVPYAGDYNADGHTDHQGAWPADAYYGDVDGTWTDSSVNDTTASDPRNRNVPGDGKFDQSVLPSNVELQVGRVDLGNLPVFRESEVELLRRYLNKNHFFRHKVFTLERRGLIDDHFGVFGGEAFAVNGWRNFAALFGDAGTVSGVWLSTLPTQGYLWGYGCGPGNYTSVGGVLDSTQLSSTDPRVAFTLFFGSYFGDWDSPNNVMRASLATPGYTLTSAWAGRPHWMVHHMGMGETIGFSTRLTQNNTGLYAANNAAHFTHIALMGDPTLRMHPVAPPSGLVIRTNGAGDMLLTWLPSPEPGAGYAIYRATSEAVSFSRLNSQLVTTTSYTPAGINSNIFMVRAVKLEVTSSGSYYNASQGVLQNLAGDYGPPTLTTQRDAAGGVLSWPARMLGYHLQAADSLAPAAWSNVLGAVQVSNNLNNVTMPAAVGQSFFRLTEP